MAALRTLLRPLVRLLIARGVTYPVLVELLKQTYVDVAAREFTEAGRAPSDSRVTLLSGVHRKDVKRLWRMAAAPARAAPPAVAFGAQLVAAWIERYSDAKGRPRPLARLRSAGGQRSFEALVESLSTDIRPRAVLDTWLRLGAAELDANDRVALRAAAFVASRGFDEKAYYLGHNVGDHVSAASHNLLGGTPPFMERSVHYDALDARSLPRLAALAEETGMKALKAVNRKAMQAEARDKSQTAPRQRITFGVYFYSEPTAKE